MLQKKVTFLKSAYNVGFTTKYQSCNNTVVFLKSFSCVRKEKKNIFDLVWFANQEQLPALW